jgi:hypothetical protein
MYDSSGSDSEDEQHEIERKRKTEELHDQLMQDVKWNVNTVVMGGLGKVG